MIVAGGMMEADDEQAPVAAAVVGNDGASALLTSPAKLIDRRSRLTSTQSVGAVADVAGEVDRGSPVSSRELQCRPPLESPH